MRLFVTSDSAWLIKISTASQKRSPSSLLLIQRGKDEELVMISPRGPRGGRGEAHTLVLVCSSEEDVYYISLLYLGNSAGVR